MSNISQDDTVETRIHDLEMEFAMLRQQLKDAATQVDSLYHEVKWLRKRLANLLPEKRHCPKCKAVVHPSARACGACGASWGKPTDPNEGLPS